MTKLSKADPKAYALLLKAVLAVLKQARSSLAPNGACVYRAEDGAKCAVGHLIPDSKYDPDMDSKYGVNVHTLFARFPKALPVPLRTATNVDYLRVLQSWHDGMRRVEKKAPQWRKLAIMELPRFIDETEVRAACEAKGIEVAP